MRKKPERLWRSLWFLHEIKFEEIILRFIRGHILASDGDNLLAPIVLAMQANIPVSTLASTMLPYPTLSEVIRQAAGML